MDNATPLNLKKKKNNFFLIANVFLMVMVVGITGFYLKDQLITTQNRAEKSQAEKEANRARRAAEEAAEKEKEERKKKRLEEERAAKKLAREEVGGGSCPAGYIKCDLNDAKGKNHKFCIPSNGSEGGCNNSAVNRGITVQTGGGSTKGEGGWRCIPGKGKDRPYVPGQPCVEANSVETIGNRAVPGCFCGVIQIDNAQGGGTYMSTCGCKSDEENTVASVNIPVTVIPTPTSPPEATPTEGPTPTEAITPTEGPTPTEGSTPTEIIVVVTNTPTPTITPGGPTLTPTPTPPPGSTSTPTPTQVLVKSSSLPSAGNPSPFLFAVPIGIIIIGLLL